MADSAYGLLLIMTGFLLQWPTIATLVMSRSW